MFKPESSPRTLEPAIDGVSEPETEAWEADDQDTGWPILRGTARQRDRRFLRKLLKAQLAVVRGAS